MARQNQVKDMTKGNGTAVEMLTKPCLFCGMQQFIRLTEDDFKKWAYEGVYVQDAFPYLSASERELLISGIHSQCWRDHLETEKE